MFAPGINPTSVVLPLHADEHVPLTTVHGGGVTAVLPVHRNPAS